MKPGIDPKVDYAFKKLFGSTANTRLLLALLNAVLQLPGERQIVALEILNPFNDKETLDDKMTILDIKARDEPGSWYNVEMQMVASPLFLERVLYCWGAVHGRQLKEGDDFNELRATISISFVNSVLFPQVADHHLHFELREANHRDLVFSELQSMHLIELPKFLLMVEELRTPLDVWCYFLKHADTLDTDQIPETMRATEVPHAMEVLQMLTQDEVEYYRYLDRMKGKWDAENTARELKALKEEARAAKEALAVAAKEYAEGIEKMRAEERLGALIHQIRLHQRLLKQAVSSEAELRSMSWDELRTKAESLEREFDVKGA